MAVERQREVTLTWWITSSKEHVEEIFRWDIWLKISIFRAAIWWMPSLFSPLIILSSFVCITQNSIGISDSCEKWTIVILSTSSVGICLMFDFSCCQHESRSCWFMLTINNKLLIVNMAINWITFKCFRRTRRVILVRVEFQSQFSVRPLELVLREIFLEPEDFVEVFALFYSVCKKTWLGMWRADEEKILITSTAPPFIQYLLTASCCSAV